MAFGGGQYTAYNKVMPGTYINTITVGDNLQTAENGVVAGGLKLDWGPDKEVFEISAEAFRNDSEAITGYPYDDPRNLELRELFKHAGRLEAYKLNSGGAKAHNEEVGEAKYTGIIGNNVTVTCYQNVNNENKYDVSTYYKGVLKDEQRVDRADLDEMELSTGDVTDGTELGEELEGKVTVEFSAEEDKVTAKYSGVPEGYTIKSRLRMGQAIVGMIPGRIEVTEKKDSFTYFIGPAAPAGEYSIEIIAQKNEGGEIKVLKTQKVTATLKEDTISGADVTKIKDNDYVTFKEDGVITEGAGYVFKGGRTNSTVNAGAYANMLTALEGLNFNNLVYDGTDASVKALFTEYTKRLRDERGIYFQTILNDYSEANHEGVISVYNSVAGDKPGNLVWWVAGYASSVDLSNELTNKPYDGELTIDVSVPDVKLQLLYEEGNLVFHKVSPTEIYTLFDVNTFTNFTEERGEELRENKVIRIIDYLHNAEAYTLNRRKIGGTPNTDMGRALIWSDCLSILEQLLSSGAIEGFTANDLTVEPIPNNRHAIKINQNFRIAGTIYYIYITTYVMQ